MKVTINKRKVDLEQATINALTTLGENGVRSGLIEKAKSFAENSRQMGQIADADTIAVQMELARLIGAEIGYEPRWDKLDLNDVYGSLCAWAKKFNKRAGVRALVKKYGVDSAARIVKKHSGKTIQEAK